MDELFSQKYAQVTQVLSEKGIGLWLVMGRETVDICDPGLRLVLPVNIMGVSAFFFTPDGKRRALVREKDVAGVVATGCFNEVEGYGDDFDERLRADVCAIDPTVIDIDVDLHDAMTDGLTAGLFLRLQRALANTPYADRLSFGQAIRSIRGRKVPAELELQRGVLRLLNRCCEELSGVVRPGTSEEDVYDFCQHFMAQHDLTPSWEPSCCPLVHAGARSNQGLVHPGANEVRPGDVFHLSFGAKQAGYATDFQRSWYVLEPGETRAPKEVQLAFDTTVAAIDSARRSARPGMPGRELHRILNEGLSGIEASGGGHAVGRALHDGCFQLSPDSSVLGDLPGVPLEEGNVFTLEVFAKTGRGVVGVEEMIVLGAEGGSWLYVPQTELWLLPGDGRDS